MNIAVSLLRAISGARLIVTFVPTALMRRVYGALLAFLAETTAIMMHSTTSSLVAVLAFAVVAPTLSAQGRNGPSAAFGLAYGTLHGGGYSSSSLVGLHASVLLPIFRPTPTSAMVVDVTADLFWNSPADGCTLGPVPPHQCLPDAPNLTAVTLGWRGQLLGRETLVLHVAAGRLSGRDGAGAVGMARLQFAPSRGWLGPELFAQAQLAPSLDRRRQATALAGILLAMR